MKMSGKLQSETRKIISNQKIKLDLNGATNLGTIKVDSEQSIKISDSDGEQISVNASQQLLVKIGSDHKATSVSTKSDPLSEEISQKIKSIHPIGKQGFLLTGSFGQSGLARLEADGMTHVIEGLRQVQKIRYSANGKVWILSQNTLYLYQPDQFNLTRVSDENLSIRDFSATSGGSVFIGGRVRSTGARFSRFVKEDMGYIVLDDDTVSGSTFSFGQDTYSSDTILDYRNNRLDIRYLPVELKHPLKINQKDQKLLSNRWFLKEGQKQELLAIDLSGGKVAGNPFKERYYIQKSMAADTNMIDFEQGLAFDGANVVKIVKTETGIKSEFFRFIVYPESQQYKLIRMFGKAQGFDGWKGIIVNKRTGMSYWVNIQEQTGEIELTERKALMIDHQQLNIKFQKISAWSPGQQMVIHLQDSGRHINYLASEITDQTISLTEITNLKENLMYSAVSGDYLYYPGPGGSIGQLNGPLKSMTTINPSFGQNSHCQIIRAVLPGYGADGMRVIMTDSGQCDGGQKKLIVFSSPDESFQNLEKKTFNLSQVKTDQIDFFTSLDASLILNTYHQSWPYQGQIRSLDEVSEQLSDPYEYHMIVQSGLTKIQIPGQLKTEIISPLGTGNMILGLRQENGYQTWSADLVTGVISEIPALEGIQVYTFNKMSDDLFLLSGLNVSQNKKADFHFDGRGEMLNQEKGQGFTVQDVFPLTFKD